MSIPSASEQTLLDNDRHSVKLYLSAYQPSTVFSCQVTGSYDSDTQTASYYNPSGSYEDVYDFDFLVALIGTTPGGDEKGRTYVRSTTDSQIRFVESGYIDWASGDYITILDFIEITSIFPYNIPDPADDENVIFYKFFDVAYTNQNGLGIGSIVNMGCDYAGFLDPASGLCDVFYSSSGTVSLLGGGVTHNWSFEGALTTGSTAHTPGTIQYDTPGHYKTIYEVTNASGTATDRSTRYISIYDRPGYGANLPILDWTITEMGGSRDSGGWRVGIKVGEVLSKPTIIDGALIVIFADEWFGTTKQNIGGNALGRQSIKFVGYVENGTVQTNYQSRDTSFTVLSPTGIMQLAECYGFSLEGVPAATVWTEMENLNVRRGLYHYLRWHSTVMKRHDLEFSGTDQSIQYFDSDRESLYSAVQNLMSGALQGAIVSDKQGKIWAEQEPAIIDSADSEFPIVQAIDSYDWLGTPIIDENPFGETSFIEMGGVYYDSATQTSSAYLCGAPGASSRYRGRVKRVQGLALSGQSDLNTRAGNMLAWDNSRYPSSDFRLRTNFAQLDIAPIELMNVTMTSSENARGITWTNKAFQIRGLNWVYDPKGQSFIPTVNLHEITQGFDAETIVIPDVPPVDVEDGDGGGSTYIPPMEVPSIPSIALAVKIYHNGTYVGTFAALNFVDDDCT